MAKPDGKKDVQRRAEPPLVASNAELPYQPLQALGERIEVACGLRTLLRIAGNDVYRVGDLVHAAVYFLGDCGLFFGGACDLGVHRVDGADQRGDGIEGLAGLVGLLLRAFALLACAEHGGHGVGGCAL